MRIADVKVDGIYLAKVTGKLVPVRVDQIVTTERGRAEQVTHMRRRRATGYRVTNLKTGRKVYLRSAQRLREPCDSAGRTARDRARAAAGQPLVDVLDSPADGPAPGAALSAAGQAVLEQTYARPGESAEQVVQRLTRPDNPPKS